jgi:hypothetical protein
MGDASSLSGMPNATPELGDTAPGPVGDAPTALPKVIYIMGAHRSGSTILGVTLGNCDGIFFAGELHSWQTRHGVPSFGGEEGAVLWDAVAQGVPEGAEMFDSDTQRLIDRTSSLYRLHRWPRRRKLKPPYRRITENLFRVVSQVTASPFVVDSSHYPLRARELQRLPGIELFIIYAVREHKKVVASLGPRDGAYFKRPTLANLQLIATHLLSAAIFLRQPAERRMVVHHEDFIAAPHDVLRQILDRIGCSSPIPDLDSLKIGSPLQGNRFMKSGPTVRLKVQPHQDGERSTVLTRIVQRGISTILSPLQPSIRPGEGAGL